MLLFTGLFKKVAVADLLLETTTGYLPQVAAEQTRLGIGAIVPMLFVGIVGTCFDIAGYIDMARGSAKLLGVEMPANFTSRSPAPGTSPTSGAGGRSPSWGGCGTTSSSHCAARPVRTPAWCSRCSSRSWWPASGTG
ncbi:MAG: hypothetical protein R2726_06520 [Acidimicrobiales bacterium]